ncbi:hypothetical protein I6N96_08105 [Enterococcus sp. BWM-S5]|uniref:Carbohydrate kinase n=1 Tax=Enterococcus larvae TaxID=2794352 RepID=A0ABS4CHZ1_9ENTE|nr:FGGY family carbohydrate kinase [Enterococcus larvae]MBP1046245.1 hypothetical protein [Enterococcus larvae]
MNKRFSITVDIGTTNAKVSLFEIATGELVSRESFQTAKKKDDFGELFDFASIWTQLLAVLTKFVVAHTGNVDSINISSVGEAGVLINEAGEIVSPLIAWYDKRGAGYIDALTTEQKKKIYDITGLPAHPNYSLSKIKWLLEKTDLSKDQAYTWLSLPDLLSYLLTGSLKTEFSMASRTMCYDLLKREWSEEILELFGLSGLIKFPEVGRSGEIVGYTSEGSISELMNETISVRIAGHDHMVGALGINLHSKELLNSTGTTEGLLLIDDTLFINDERFHDSLSNGIFTDPSCYTLFSSMPTGGNAFAWYQEFFDIGKKAFEEECLQLYKSYQKHIVDLNKQLVIVPHFNGSGAPFKNSQSSGMIYGLNLTTRREDILLGLLAGLCLEMKYVSRCFPMERVERLVVIGPAVKNPLWLQMKADSLNKEIAVVQMDEAVSFGALKAAYRDFVYPIDYQIISPDKEHAASFEELIDNYAQLYEAKRNLVEQADSPFVYQSTELNSKEYFMEKDFFFS